MLPMAGFFCASLGARRAYAEAPLSGIKKPGSGTEPIHQGLSHYELNNSGVIAFFYGIET